MCRVSRRGRPPCSAPLTRATAASSSGSSWNTWEPEGNLECTDTLAAFQRRWATVPDDERQRIIAELSPVQPLPAAPAPAPAAPAAKAPASAAATPAGLKRKGRLGKM